MHEENAAYEERRQIEQRNKETGNPQNPPRQAMEGRTNMVVPLVDVPYGSHRRRAINLPTKCHQCLDAQIT